MLERIFRLSKNNTNIQTETIGGATTFMTMAYIIFVNPMILKDAGVPFEGAVSATCLAAGIATLLMGLWANYPFALAPGMGLNAMLAYSVVLANNYSWQAAMGIVFVEGAVILVLVLLGAREAVMRAIPDDLRRAIGVGIGVFIAFIGLANAGIVRRSDATLLTHGDVASPDSLLAVFGLLLTLLFLLRRVRGALLLGIILTTLVGMALTNVSALKLDLVRFPEKALSIPSLETIGRVDLHAVLRGGLDSLTLIFAFLMVDFFDTLGTVTGLGEQAGYTSDGKLLPRLNRVLAVDSIGAVTGGLFGASSVTTYIESAAGIGEGARSGLACVIVAFLFFLSAFLSPIVGIVPPAATAPALIVTGFLMMGVVRKINFSRIESAFPAFIILILIPLTYSISRGIGYGFIAYSFATLFTGRFLKVSPLFHLVSLLFLISFVLG
ncbi:MAG: NCS2 family permease [bacterium]